MLPGGVRVTWPAVADRDNENLTYRVIRKEDLTSGVGSVIGVLSTSLSLLFR